MANHRDPMKPDISRNSFHNQRFFDAQNYPMQNPYDTPLPGNYYPYQTGYEFDEHTPQDYGNGRFGQATYHHHVYSTVGAGGGHGGGGGGGSGGHKSKSSALAMSGLTLLAFLFFINMLQTCLKEQMTSLNPTVMVMTAGTSRFRKTGTPGTETVDGNKELMQSDHTETGVIGTSVSDNIDMITNDQGDLFFRPAPKISYKLDDSFVVENGDASWEEIKQRT